MAHVPVKTKIASIKLTPEQYRKIEQRAARRGVRTSTWMRAILLQAVDKQAREGYLRIKEPDGTTM